MVFTRRPPERATVSVATSSRSAASRAVPAGSRRWASSVEPTRSAKATHIVARRRSSLNGVSWVRRWVASTWWRKAASKTVGMAFRASCAVTLARANSTGGMAPRSSGACTSVRNSATAASATCAAARPSTRLNWAMRSAPNSSAPTSNWAKMSASEGHHTAASSGGSGNPRVRHADELPVDAGQRGDLFGPQRGLALAQHRIGRRRHEATGGLGGDEVVDRAALLEQEGQEVEAVLGVGSRLVVEARGGELGGGPVAGRTHPRRADRRARRRPPVPS